MKYKIITVIFFVIIILSGLIFLHLNGSLFAPVTIDISQVSHKTHLWIPLNSKIIANEYTGGLSEDLNVIIQCSPDDIKQFKKQNAFKSIPYSHTYSDLLSRVLFPQHIFSNLRKNNIKHFWAIDALSTDLSNDSHTWVLIDLDRDILYLHYQS